MMERIAEGVDRNKWEKQDKKQYEQTIMGKLCECKQKTHAKVTFECIVLDLHIQCKQYISVVNYITFSLLCNFC